MVIFFQGFNAVFFCLALFLPFITSCCVPAQISVSVKTVRPNLFLRNSRMPLAALRQLLFNLTTRGRM